VEGFQPPLVVKRKDREMQSLPFLLLTRSYGIFQTFSAELVTWDMACAMSVK
jgi:hypothetical protein